MEWTVKDLRSTHGHFFTRHTDAALGRTYCSKEAFLARARRKRGHVQAFGDEEEEAVSFTTRHSLFETKGNRGLDFSMHQTQSTPVV